jgi:hypothetical protein
MPTLFMVGVALVLAPSMLLRLYDRAWGQDAPPVMELIRTVDIYAMSALLLYFNLALVTTLGALIVMVMKGPAYVADAYPLIDADAPGQTREQA